jgi:hypothetical protein
VYWGITANVYGAANDARFRVTPETAGNHGIGFLQNEVEIVSSK